MPYNIWCGGCNSMIAKGVRFNAEKKQVGNYYSTKVCYNCIILVFKGWTWYNLQIFIFCFCHYYVGVDCLMPFCLLVHYFVPHLMFHLSFFVDYLIIVYWSFRYGASLWSLLAANRRSSFRLILRIVNMSL